MDEEYLTAPDYLDEEWIANHGAVGTGPTDEMLERLCSQPLFQHWKFDEGASARQAFVYPVLPRATAEAGKVGDVFSETPCEILIEMPDGRIAAYRFVSAVTFTLTRDLIETLATQLESRLGRHQKLIPPHVSPYSTKAACRLCKRVLEASVNTGTRENIGMVLDCTGDEFELSHFDQIVGSALQHLFLFEGYLDPIKFPIENRSRRLAMVIRDGLCDFIDALVANITRANMPSHLWLFLHNYLNHPDPVVRRNRRQAHDLLPLCVMHLVNQKSPSKERRRIVFYRIDAGHSPFAIFAEAYGVSNGTLRDHARHAQILAGPIGRFDPNVPSANMLRALDMLSPQHRPQKREDWFGFTLWVGLLCKHLPELDTESVARLLSEVGQIGWCQFDEWSAQKYGVRTQLGIEDCLIALHAYLRIASPQLLGLNVAPMAFKQLTIRKLLRATRLWHQAVVRVNDEYLCALHAEGSTQERWAWPLPTVFELNAFSVHSLRDPTSLAEEGSAMNHCVITLTGQCRAGQARVFSLRNTLNKRCSTFDLSFSRDEKGTLLIRLREHHGHSNSPPDPKWRNVVNSFVSWLKEPAQTELLAGVKELGRNNVEIDYLAGEQWMDPEEWVGIEAVRRCREALGLDQTLGTAPTTIDQDKTAPCGDSLNITLTSPQPAIHRLLNWMEPHLPVENGQLQWKVKSPKEALSLTDSDLDVIVCDYSHDVHATTTLARSLMDAGHDVIVLMPRGSDVTPMATHGVLAIAMGEGKYGVLDDLAHTLLLPSVQEGHICMDWADTRSVMCEEGLGEIYWEIGNNIEEAALKICDRFAAYQPEGLTIKAALFVLPSRVDFMEKIFRPANEILRRKVPKNATLIFAAPYVQATQDYRIGAFVVYG